MKREILFRGVCSTDYSDSGIKKGDLLYGDLSENKPFAYISPKDSYLSYSVEPDTVSQYTGICDKNGNKIFEGDYFRLESVNWNFRVVYSDGCFLTYKDNKIFALLKDLRGILLVQ